MEITKKPEKLLDIALEVLQKSYKQAKKKGDLEIMLAISDRLMVLYTTLQEIEGLQKGKPLGFVDIDSGAERG